MPLIVLFWSDTDIRSGGNIYYRNVSDDETLRQAYSILIHNYTTSSSGFYPTSVFIATWSEVPQSFTVDQLYNTYQVVLMTDGETSYVCFLYEDIQWGEGAGIGFNAGDDTNRSSTVPGALTSETLDMENQSNVGRPGVFIYQVDGM